jgi:hypothetical protein
VDDHHSQGPAEIRINADRITGIVDHKFAEFSMTIFEPPQLDDVEFERQLQLIETELAVLKDVLER